MLVTEADVIKDKDILRNLKAWAGRLNVKVKTGEFQVFKVIGQQVISSRIRRSGPAKDRSYDGGEGFGVSSIVIESSKVEKQVEILVLLVPSDLSLMGEVSCVTMPLARALDVLEGFREWADVDSIKPASLKYEEGLTAKLPTVQAVRASEQWGAW